MEPLRVLETCLYVDDLAVAEQFYRDVLQLPFVSRKAGRHVFFRCGAAMLLIFDPHASNASDSDLPRHGSHGRGHVAFAVSEDEIDHWIVRLAESRIDVEQIIEWPGGGRSVYFRDPAGNSLEFVNPRIWNL